MSTKPRLCKEGPNQTRLIGNSRQQATTCYPPHVVRALLTIAHKEHKSYARVQAEIIYESLGLDESGWFAKGERTPARIVPFQRRRA